MDAESSKGDLGVDDGSKGTVPENNAEKLKGEAGSLSALPTLSTDTTSPCGSEKKVRLLVLFLLLGNSCQY